MKYGYQKTVGLSYKKVNKKLRESLMNKGFGIITEINVRETFKEKLNIDYQRFQILGACNPGLAKEALDLEREVAMFLPCNVIFWENKDGSVTISAIDAEKQVGLTNNEELFVLGKKVNEMLIKAIDLV